MIYRLMWWLLWALPLQVWAQGAAPPDTLSLEEVRGAAAERDPAAVQPALLEAIAELRLENVRAQRLPQVALTGQATYQNEVPSIPAGAGGATGPPLDQYRAQAEVDWLLYSGGRLAREAEVERARLAENLAGVAVTLNHVRDGATETFFAILLYQAQAEALNLSVEDLQARLDLTQARVRDGAALPADAAMLEAELIQLRQQSEEAEANRQAALTVLGAFLDREIPASTVLVLPELEPAIAQTVRGFGASAGLIRTPEVQQLAYQGARLQAEADVVTARLRPNVSLFGQVGMGRPGPFNFLSDEVNEFGVVGVRLRWSLMDWGQARRTRRMLQQQADVTAHHQVSAERRIWRDIQDERATITRLMRTLADDERVVELREQALNAAQQQLEEGVLLPASYTDRLSDLTAARVTQQRHRIERARAQARLLSALGRFPGDPVPSLSTATGSLP